MKTRILLVDDHQIVLDGLKLILRGQEDLEVVGEALDGDAALARAVEVEADIAVVDLHMPRLSGTRLLRCFRERHSNLKLIVLSADADEQLVEEVLQTGVSGYVLKLNAGTELLRAIQAVRSGQAFFSPEVAATVASGYRRALAAARAAVGSTLSAREQQILGLIAEGRTTKEIAHQLRLSPKTVETHRLHIMDKLSLFSIAELTKYAIREGLTPL